MFSKVEMETNRKPSNSGQCHCCQCPMPIICGATFNKCRARKKTKKNVKLFILFHHRQAIDENFNRPALLPFSFRHIYNVDGKESKNQQQNFQNNHHLGIVVWCKQCLIVRCRKPFSNHFHQTWYRINFDFTNINRRRNRSTHTHTINIKHFPMIILFQAKIKGSDKGTNCWNSKRKWFDY